MEETRFTSRSVAYKIPLSSIENGTYVAGKDDEPTHFITADQNKVGRINIIAIIVQKEVMGTVTNLLLDDGTGRIVLRSFEESKVVENLLVGDVVLVVGKVREYNSEKYISSEIIKKIDSVWLKVRSKENEKFVPAQEERDEEPHNVQPLREERNVGELSVGFVEAANVTEEKVEEKVDLEKNTENSVEQVVDEENEDVLLPTEKLLSLIKELDEGDGVLIETVIEKSFLEGTEDLIQKMLERGDVFQNQPGKVKVL